MNWLDGIIGFISPEWGARREAWRQSLTEMRNYDAGNYDRGKASYWQRGETLDYKNTGSSTIEANTVVELTGRVGIAGTDIAPGAEGDLHVCGVFEFDKTGTNEIAFGQPVYFDKTGITDAANNGETSGSKVAYTPAGFAAKAAAAGDAKVLVKIG